MTSTSSLDATPAEPAGTGAWVRLCPLDRLIPGRGRAALVGGQQVAVFRLFGEGDVHAIGNRDPFSGAQVLSRGIVGDRGGVPKVASPVYKQSFDLRTGRCLDDPEVAVPTYRVRVEEGWVLVEAPAASGP
jgi:nitrite reductase (NADH) small subunit